MFSLSDTQLKLKLGGSIPSMIFLIKTMVEWFSYLFIALETESRKQTISNLADKILTLCYIKFERYYWSNYWKFLLFTDLTFSFFVKLIISSLEILSEKSDLTVFQNFLFSVTKFGSTLEECCWLALRKSVAHKLRCFW